MAQRSSGANPKLDAKYFKNRNVTEKEVYEFKKAFDIIDQDKSGKISISEMNAAFVALGMGAEAKTIGEVFTSGDREIDFDEFFNLLTKEDRDQLNDHSIGNYFKLLDQNETGALDAADLLELSKMFGDNFDAQQINDMISVLASDGKCITPEDFAALLYEGEEALLRQQQTAAQRR